jgi:hypothetical protein
MTSIQNRFQVFSHNNGKLVVVAQFQVHQYKEAIECCEAQKELLTIMGSTFSPFVSDMNNRGMIVAEAGKGDLDKWNTANKGNFLAGYHLTK